MRKTKHWLMTIAALLCSVMVDAATYSDWTSTNKGQSSTTSSNTYTITANAGDVLTFDWLVSSESNYDMLIITIGGTEILNKSGELSGTYQHTFTSSGTYTMVVKYTKDGGVDRGSDYAKVYNITLGTGDAGGSDNSGTENIVASGTCGDNLTWKLTIDGEMIVEGTGDMPNNMWGAWPSSCYSATKKVTILEGVTSIGEYAFAEFDNLTSITIPTSIIKIGYSPCYWCNSLTSVYISDIKAWYDIEFEGTPLEGSSDLYLNGELLTEVTIPSSSSIVKNAFAGCASLTSVVIPEEVTCIGEHAFDGCSSLSSVTIPESVTSIGNHAFADCDGLTSITLPESVTCIGARAFAGCTNLTTIDIPNGVNSVGLDAFLNTKWFKNQQDGVIYIGKVLYMYKGVMPENTMIEVKEGTVHIGEVAFADCSGLTSIYIPEGVASIGREAFARCYNLEFIAIPGSVSHIEDETFIACINLASVTIPNGIKSIGSMAFQACKNLTYITLPESVTSIGDSAFGDCPNLASIIIPEGLISIGYNAFVGCSNLAYINIPNSVTSIGSCAFNSCTNLTSITIPNRITEISEGLFAYCTSLENITIPNSVTSIGGQAFYCSGLKSIKIPASVTNIGYFAFEYCENLTSIEIPNSITTLEGGVFAYCSNLKEVSIPNSVTILGPYNSGMEGPFEACTSLKSVNIPESVTIIGECAFNLCTGLTSIYCEATLPPTCGGLAFSEVDKSIPVYVPSSSVSAYQSAAGWNEFKNIRSMPGSITINQYGSGTYCSEYALDFSEVEGLKAYAATGFNTETGIVTLTRVMTSKPGIGLFIKGEPGEYVVPTLEKTNDNSLNMLVGTLEDVTVGKLSSDERYANYKYTIKAGDVEPMFHNFDDGFALSAGKAYLQIPVEWLPTMEARSIGIRFDDGDGATDIDNAEIRNQKSEIVYDLMGRRVASPKKGELYIIDGKKVIY